MTLFKKSQKKSIKIKIAITGASGSGKTFSALRLANGLGKKIAVIDTENGSASLYADKFDFDVLELKPPFETEKYIHAIKDAENAGYEVLIIDSLSHAWAAEGGLLEQKEKLDSYNPRSNTYTNWAAITKKHEMFKSAILHSDLHVICTMRSKQDYVLELNDKGKMVPKKIGMAPVQRDGLEYEFTTVFDIAMNHEAIASKDRTDLFSDKIFPITEDIGKQIKNWLSSNSVSPTNKEELVRILGSLGEEYKNVSRETLNTIYAKLKHEYIADSDLEPIIRSEIEHILKENR
jgi:AAA domain